MAKPIIDHHIPRVNFIEMHSNPLILALETATMAGSVCLARGREILVSRIGDATSSHSNTLLRDIEYVLNESRIELSSVDAFAVAIGPGSFTGLRIGLATTKALASTLNRPCLGVPTLEAVASAAASGTNVVASLPAGRGEVFEQRFSVQAEGEVVAQAGPSHVSPGKMIGKYSHLTQVCWAGEGAILHRHAIEEYSEQHSLHWTLAPAEQNLARHVLLIGLSSYSKMETTNPDMLSAIYVRPSDAELKVNVVNN